MFTFTQDYFWSFWNHYQGKNFGYTKGDVWEIREVGVPFGQNSISVTRPFEYPVLRQAWSKSDQTLKVLYADAHNMWVGDMASNSTDNSATIDSHIAYHNEMEHIANRVGDFTKADHHRKMQEIYKAMKEKQQLYKTCDQSSDEVQFEKASW